jgi:Zn-finger nucleic acid-binding protein
VVGPYRNAASDDGPKLPRCTACELSLLAGGAWRVAGTAKATLLAGSRYARNSVACGDGCPACLVSLSAVTLDDGERWMVIEECPSCGLLVLDDGELAKLVEFVRSGAGLPFFDVRIVTSSAAPQSSSPTLDELLGTLMEIDLLGQDGA